MSFTYLCSKINQPHSVLVDAGLTRCLYCQCSLELPTDKTLGQSSDLQSNISSSLLVASTHDDFEIVGVSQVDRDSSRIQNMQRKAKPSLKGGQWMVNQSTVENERGEFGRRELAKRQEATRGGPFEMGKAIGSPKKGKPPMVSDSCEFRIYVGRLGDALSTYKRIAVCSFTWPDDLVTFPDIQQFLDLHVFQQCKQWQEYYLKCSGAADEEDGLIPMAAPIIGTKWDSDIGCYEAPMSSYTKEFTVRSFLAQFKGPAKKVFVGVRLQYPAPLSPTPEARYNDSEVESPVEMPKQRGKKAVRKPSAGQRGNSKSNISASSSHTGAFIPPPEKKPTIKKRSHIDIKSTPEENQSVKLEPPTSPTQSPPHKRITRKTSSEHLGIGSLTSAMETLSPENLSTDISTVKKERKGKGLWKNYDVVTQETAE